MGLELINIRVSIVVSITPSFRACLLSCHCRSYILDLMEGGRKLIVFGHHRSVLNSVCETLREKVMMPSYTERREVMNSSFFMLCKDVRLVLLLRIFRV